MNEFDVAKVLKAKTTNNLSAGEAVYMSSNLKATIEKIKSLENEKKSLQTEIESLKKQADAKALELEDEVDALRDEVKSLKTLMGPAVVEAAPIKA